MGDVLDRLREMPDKSVHCCVTSPPYWGLRDYGVDGQIGLEPTPESFVAKMVEVFGEVRRVLRDDGTCWVNLGDSYAGGGRGGNPADSPFRKQATNVGSLVPSSPIPNGLKPKDLVGVPWRVAFALQASGWYLRSDVIWHKRSPMPESVQDRPTKAHEYVFLLTKGPRYFYDAVAVEEQASENTHSRGTNSRKKQDDDEASIRSRNNPSSNDATYGDVATRNLRTVWTLSTEPCPEAHFATFPSELPTRCIKAGTSEHGVCPSCGAPWIRVTEKQRKATRPGKNSKVNRASDDEDSPYHGHSGMIVGNRDPKRHCSVTVTKGWEPSCECKANVPIPATVLEPFAGAGTTLLAAQRLGRRSIGIELNPEYVAIAEKRIQEDWSAAPLFESAG